MSRSDDILGAASGLLALRPGATMEAIAAAAGVSRATLFRRFPSRDALVAELSREAAGAFVAAVEAARPEEGPALEALGRVLRGMVALAPRWGLLLLQPLPEVVEADLLAEVAETEGRITALVVRGQEAGELRADLPAAWVLQAMTWLVVAAADGIRLGRLAPADVERLVSETVMGAVRRGPR